MGKHVHSRLLKLAWLGLLAGLTLFARAGLAETMEGISADPSATPSAAPVCKNAGVTVSFVPGSNEIDTNGRGALAGVATWLKNGDHRTVRLVGYTDRAGSATANQKLSEKRAQAAKDFLLGRGIEPDRVMVFGHGEQDMLTGAEARVVVVTACDVPPELAAETPPPLPPPPEPAPAAAEPEPAPEPAPTAAAEPEPAPPPAPIVVPVTAVPPPMAVNPDKPASGLGIEATVGGGAIGFIDEGARNVANTGASWDARLMFGSRLPIAVEGAYVGSVQSIDALGLSTNSLLVGNGVEGTLRINLTRMRVQPYVFGGVGWTHYQLSNTATNTSSILGRDDIGTVPLGAGVTARFGRGFIFDARGTYRATFDDQLMQGQSVNDTSMQTWNATARIGFEF
jgi:hypothetical protein